MADLTTVFAGLTLRNPIIIGSSGLSDSTENIRELEKSGAGAVVLKSLFEEEILKEMNASMHRMGSEGFLYPETVDFYDYYESPEEATINNFVRLSLPRRRLTFRNCQHQSSPHRIGPIFRSRFNRPVPVP
jgi:dihydroorotate dehydrogenase (fumarate)